MNEVDEMRAVKSDAMKSVRQPQHHGVFYPADPLLLKRQLNDCLRQADVYRAIGGNAVSGGAINGRIKALVVPHAGYAYSAHIAARAYAAVRGQGWIRRIVILGPNHQTAMAGGLLSSHDGWMTPLGEVEIDQQFIRQYWLGLDHVSNDDVVHQAEYSIEVQLPFVQRVLVDVPVVPMLLGDCTPQQLAAILHPAWACDETLIIISSDLYHYLPCASALPAGMTIARAFEQNDSAYIGPETACGYVALRGLMRLAGTLPCYWRTLVLGHSGESGYSADNLVGYGAFLLITPSACRLTN